MNPDIRWQFNRYPFSRVGRIKFSYHDCRKGTHDSSLASSRFQHYASKQPFPFECNFEKRSGYLVSLCHVHSKWAVDREDVACDQTKV